jgi:pimeloyl-ACP methyl ester carboxylesterase
MKLRLHHHPDGTRVAYREAGTGPKLALLHSAGLSHREFEPLVEHLADRFRLVLPDLPLHGDSEDHPRRPYSPEWMAEVMAHFCHEVLGPRPLVAGHDAGAEILLHAAATQRISPTRMVLMPNRMHGSSPRAGRLRVWRAGARAARVPGLDRALSHGAARLIRPSAGQRLSARANPAAQDLIRHAVDGVAGNGNRARAWGKLARNWPMQPQRHLLDAYAGIDTPTLLLWADADRRHPLALAEEALERLPAGQLRVLSGTGFLIAYDDPVGVARELAAFLGPAARP